MSRVPLSISWTRAGLWLCGGGVAALLLLPGAYLLIRAVGESDAAWRVLLRWGTVEVIGRTLGLSLAVTVAAMLVAVPLAWLTMRTDLPLRRLWAVLTPLPLVIPSYVGAYLAASALGPRGLLQQALEPIFGIERLPNIYGFPGALFALTMLSYPYVLLSVRAALNRMDPALEEASRSLGESAWATFRRVTLPHLRPALGAGGLLVALYALRDFGAVSIMRYSTFTRAIYVQYQSYDRSAAAGLALILVALTFAILLLEARTRGRGRYHPAGIGTPRPPGLVQLGVWRWPALAFCSLVVLASLVMPATVLGLWLIRGLRAGETMAPVIQAAGNSALAAALASACVVLAALPVALLVTRYKSRLTQLLERLTYSAFALPGIVVALALVFFGANYALPLYQTLPMLIIAYTILFIPQAFGTLRATLLQIPPSLEEMARSLGKRPSQVFATITLPLLRPGLLSGAALVFLTAMVELPATLLLAPIGFRTLSGLVWSSVSEAFFARAALPALLMVLISSVPMSLLILRDGQGRVQAIETND